MAKVQVELPLEGVFYVDLGDNTEAFVFKGGCRSATASSKEDGIVFAK
jgi:hypothetical protein